MAICQETLKDCRQALSDIRNIVCLLKTEWDIRPEDFFDMLGEELDNIHELCNKQLP